MPASTRPHRTLAVLVHCLGVLTALPALPTPDPPRAAVTPVVAPASPSAVVASASPAPVVASASPSAPVVASASPPARTARAEPARPAAATAGPGTRTTPGAGSPSTRPGADRGTPPAVRVRVAPAGTPAPAYRIEVRNDGNAPVATTVRQELPPGSSATTVSAGGRTTRSAGRADSAEVTWRLTLPARSTTTLNTALTAAVDRPLTAPACAFDGSGNRPYDCATATWHQAAKPEADAGPTPFWQRPTTLLAAGALLLAVLAATGWWLLRRRRRVTGATTGRFGADPGVTGRPDSRGTVYPRPAVPSPAYRRRRPPVWLVVGMALAILAGVVGAAAWTATTRVAAIDTGAQPTSGAWTGPGHAGPLGVPLREAAFEFTVYRMACDPATARRRCQATVGVRNLTPQQQVWHGELQRAYLPDGRWVNADEPATRAANQGRDVFAEPVAADGRMLVPLVFTVAGPEPPNQVELRSGVFSAGVRVDVP
ncbi:hypothetical protein [Micromonospora sp. NBRC 101691]|uniref:hypothetical protein n=1 Tax=Micromonospora sp. NBRC 101691 TaxID=3032198 RepID=UPI0024A16D4B|nr:hypothetical protein [Micromonospora sp. NBRC 101691]GLY24573.1 hypothetical protein Misp04_43050 [Micromonospora sp. NBRC 101691]